MDFDMTPASEYPLLDLAELLNRGFEGYFVPINFNVNALLNIVRKDGIDLTSSRVLIADGEPAGVALIARRGWTSRLAAMGIATETRGMGAGFWFMQQLIREACDRGEHEMFLEVIEQNGPAVHLYEKCGFEIVRRLISLIRKEAVEEQPRELREMDVREAAAWVTQYGLSNLPWQLSGESLAQMNPPVCAYRNEGACIIISDPQVNDIVIWALVVEPHARDNGLGQETLKAIMTQYPMKTWHVPAILPEELGKVYERAGFIREQLSQWQMKLNLPDLNPHP
jgi:ribosomal protein S18 acetylase RimI-like enzyme